MRKSKQLTLTQLRRRAAEKDKQRRAAIRARARKLVESAKARAAKIVEAARIRARELIATSKRLVPVKRRTSKSTRKRAEPMMKKTPVSKSHISERTKKVMLDSRAKELILEHVRKMGGTSEKPIRIPSLRKRLSLLLKPSRFDKALGELQLAKVVVLYRDDNSVTAEREGAYFTGGQPRHILYLR